MMGTHVRTMFVTRAYVPFRQSEPESDAEVHKCVMAEEFVLDAPMIRNVMTELSAQLIVVERIAAKMTHKLMVLDVQLVFVIKHLVRA